MRCTPKSASSFCCFSGCHGSFWHNTEKIKRKKLSELWVQCCGGIDGGWTWRHCQFLHEKPSIIYNKKYVENWYLWYSKVFRSIPQICNLQSTVDCIISCLSLQEGSFDGKTDRARVWLQTTVLCDVAGSWEKCLLCYSVVFGLCYRCFLLL